MWRRLGDVDPKALEGARVQAHWAVQVLGAVGNSWVAAREDDGHTAASWEDERRRLHGAPVNATAEDAGVSGVARRVSLALDDFRLAVVDDVGHDLATLSLDERTLGEALRWVADTFAAFGHADALGPLERGAWPMPEHPLGQGAAFDTSGLGPALGELQRWFANAFLVLDAMTEGDRATSPARLWPHHFDVSAVLTLAQDDDGRVRRTLGLGFSPGQDEVDEPYVYVNVWPQPGASAHAVLNFGEWHRDRWFGALLRGSKIAALPGPQQQGTVETFLADAMAALHKMS